MVMVFYAITVCLLWFRYVSTDWNNLIPSFSPYCSTKPLCQIICACEIFPNCSLLAVNDTFRSSILFYHNRIRDKQSRTNLQPSGMTVIQYDAQLEQISRCLAARCRNEFSECFSTPNFPETSQSVMQISLTDWLSPNVILWMQEMESRMNHSMYISAEIVNSLPPGEEGQAFHNFAQILSDSVISVGCAWSRAADNVLTFVCSYGPRGPNPGEEVYKLGYACSFCPENYLCDFEEPYSQLCKPKFVSPIPPDLLSYPSAYPAAGTPPQLPPHPVSPFPPSSADPYLSAHPQFTTLADEPAETDATIETHETTEDTTIVENENENEFGVKKADSDSEAKNKSRQMRHHHGMIIGVMITLLLLTLVSAITIVILYTHGFGCR